MTINAINKVLSIAPGQDGVRNSKFPDGSDPDTWAWEGLSAGLSGFTEIETHGTVAWDAGGFATITYSEQGVTALEYSLAPMTTQAVIQFDIRRSGTDCSKICKVLSAGTFVAPYTKVCQITWPSGGYSSNTVRITGYSDRSNGGDSQISVRTTGTISGSYTREAPTYATTTSPEVTMDVGGSTWHTFKLWFKNNSDNTQDGEFAVWLDGALKLHMTEVWNCATTDSDGTNPGVSAGDLTLYQYKDRVQLGAYANVGGFSEDFRNFKISYLRPSSLP